MIILRNLQDIQNWVSNVKKQGETIGFVPTMGALHAGHLSLVGVSTNENDQTIVSVFVNPTQFNNSEDLKKYPRTEEADIELLKDSGADAVFIPDIATIYPEGQFAKKFNFGELENKMEGEFRPGHFDGVATVVSRLFELVQPDRAYFGEKDFQQLRIIQQLVRTEKIPVQIVPVPIKREMDGLAMSSRNVRLSPQMRVEAPKIYTLLQEAKAYLETHTVSETKNYIEQLFEQTNLNLEYFEIADEDQLNSVYEKDASKKLRAFVAVFADEIRLIDNLALN